MKFSRNKKNFLREIFIVKFKKRILQILQFFQKQRYIIIDARDY